MEDNIAIKVDHVSKTFRLPHDKQNSIKGGLISLLKNGKRAYETQKVLRDVSFEIKKGEFFGIVGRNGSGKSTLLKMLASIYQPTSGNITVNGSLTPFIELGVGFNPELTGRENVFLNGALLGFNRDEMTAMYDDIVEFAELERFMDQKLKNYSSGMQVRLAFSIAIRAHSEILLLDEVLAVGDEAFQRKCYEYFETLKRDKKTVVLVTHDMSAVERFCSQAMLIEAGEIIDFGLPEIVAHSYTRLFAEVTQDEEKPKPNKKPTSMKQRKRWGTKALELGDVRVVPPKPGDKTIVVTLQVKRNVTTSPTATLAYTVKARDRRSLFGYCFELPDVDIVKLGEIEKYRFSFDNVLSEGYYYIDLSLRDKKQKTDEYMDFWIDATSFQVEGTERNALNLLVGSRMH